MLLEICIDSCASALAAKQGGADRLEVCSALAVGGTTPSLALLDHCVQTLGMPSMMMIRPHDGGFVYSEDDIRIMISSIETAKQVGARGVVFGALTSNRNIDVETCKRLLDVADGLETTFHRAIDVVVDPLESLAIIEELGMTRVLTSGQKSTAIEGAELLSQMVQQSSKISILAGAGLNASNVYELIQKTEVKEVHASASVPVSEAQTNTHVSFGGQRRITSESNVRSLTAQLGRFASSG